MPRRQETVEDYVADHVPLGLRLRAPSPVAGFLAGRPCKERYRKSRVPPAWKRDELARLFKQYKMPIGRRRKSELCDIAEFLRSGLVVPPGPIPVPRVRSPSPRRSRSPNVPVRRRSRTPVRWSPDVQIIDHTPVPEPTIDLTGGSTVVPPAPSRSNAPCYLGNFPKIPLHPHQWEAVRRILPPTTKGLLLNFKVGSGKTIASIASAQALMDTGVIKGVVYVGAGVIQRQVRRDMNAVGGDVRHWTLITPQMFRLHPVNTTDKLLVVDEAHTFRNPGGQMTQSMLRAASQAKKVLLLTGTPVVNAPEDMRPLMNMVNPRNHTSVNDYETLSDNLKHAVQCSLIQYAPPPNANYPTSSRRVREVYMSREQCKVHWSLNNRSKMKELAKLLGRDSMTEDDMKKLTVFLITPRQACNVLSNGDGPKLNAIAKAIRQQVRSGLKVVAYSEFLEKGVYALSTRLDDLGVQHRVVTGRVTSATQKSAIIADYNEDRVKVLLFSGAISEGIDLLHTGVVHIVQPAFNEASIQQVIGRAVRQNSHTDPGVPKHVDVYEWVAKMDPSYDAGGVAWRKQSADEIVHKICLAKKTLLDTFMTKVVQWSSRSACPRSKWCE